MTDEELDAIEKRARAHPPDDPSCSNAGVLALVAEVRRLRAGMAVAAIAVDAAAEEAGRLRRLLDDALDGPSRCSCAHAPCDHDVERLRRENERLRSKLTDVMRVADDAVSKANALREELEERGPFCSHCGRNELRPGIDSCDKCRVPLCRDRVCSYRHECEAP